MRIQVTNLELLRHDQFAPFKMACNWRKDNKKAELNALITNLFE
jgi:hypothetical protein